MAHHFFMLQSSSCVVSSIVFLLLVLHSIQLQDNFDEKIRKGVTTAFSDAQAFKQPSYFIRTYNWAPTHTTFTSILGRN